MGKVLDTLRLAVEACARREVSPASQARAAAAAGSGAVLAGSVTDVFGEALDIYRTPNGSVLVFGDGKTALGFDPGSLAELLEVLGRADMAGVA